MNKKIVTIGEILMRMTTPGHRRFSQSDYFNVHFGGAEANVAISLAQLGIECYHITVLPNHEIGKSVIDYLKSRHVRTDYIEFSDQGRIGLYFMETGAMHRSSKIIYDRFHSSFSKIKSDFFNWEMIFKGADWLHWTGITPAISEETLLFCEIAINKAKEYGVKVSGDINYRRNLWNFGRKPLEVMPDLISKTDVIIAGLTDFENCLGIKEEDFESACKKTVRLYPNIEAIATTNRISHSTTHNVLSALMYKDNKLYTSKEYELKNIIDRIGSGDAFMAGLIYGLLHKEDQQALEFGLAASVLKHSIEGDANLADVREIEMLVSGNNIGKLLR
ncbi:sugar kinase [Aquimarina algicola]|uniref:Sugar kinase n=1 Tax=Aquimarina algicola TaxID=2589995 RepID=A0A504IS78_9FLAO|nr:sugar kinase [Aquimarina algicola]TPN81196.1 sugar kinase [Aquimarina algicola]